MPAQPEIQRITQPAGWGDTETWYPAGTTAVRNADGVAAIEAAIETDLGVGVSVEQVDAGVYDVTWDDNGPQDLLNTHYQAKATWSKVNDGGDGGQAGLAKTGPGQLSIGKYGPGVTTIGRARIV